VRVRRAQQDAFREQRQQQGGRPAPQALPPQQQQAEGQGSASSSAGLFEENIEACLTCKKVQVPDVSSPRKAGGSSKASGSGNGDATSTCTRLPGWAGLYVAACARWPTLGLRLLEVAVPLLLLLLPSGRTAGLWLQAGGWGGVPILTIRLWALAQLALSTLQLMFAREASRHASWRMALATDAAHLALVARALV
jgi:hypothetical protein